MTRERVVPTKFKEVLSLRKVYKLTFVERLKLLFGFNIQIDVGIQTQHIVGKTKQGIKVTVTKQLEDAKTPNAVIRV